MKSRNTAGLSRPDLLLGIAITFMALCLLSQCIRIIAPHSSLTKAQMTLTLSQMKYLHDATSAMATDGLATTNTALGWPGDTGGTFAHWANTLVKEGYLKQEDFQSLLIAPGLRRPQDIPQATTNALLLYAVRANSPTNAVFLTTANFTNTPTGGLPLQKDARPYGDKGIVVFRKGGDGTVYKKSQVGDTNALGSFVPLLK